MTPNETFGKCALVVDRDPPDPDTSGGGYAAINELKLLRALGYTCHFVTPSGFDSRSASKALIATGAVDPTSPITSVTDFLAHRECDVDLVYITRYDVCEDCLAEIRASLPATRVVLNVADLHFLRAQRRATAVGTVNDAQAGADIAAAELSTIARVDRVLTYTQEELDLLKSVFGHGVDARLAPWLEYPATEPAVLDGRAGIVFVGSFEHEPNLDGIVWFIQNVMPELRQAVPNVQLRVYGAGIPESLRDLADEPSVYVGGWVEDLNEVYAGARVIIAPLRFGAGIKVKVTTAISQGVPVVLSPIAAEGIFTKDQLPGSVAESIPEWVAALQKLMADDRAWRQTAQEELAIAQQRFNLSTARELMMNAVDDWPDY